MFSRGTLTAFVLSMGLAVLADPTPSTPSPGQVFQEGGNCDIAWTPDASGLWKTMNIQLMTGDNLQMVPLTTVATVDGTASPGTFTYPCPSVTIHAPIYFYQFSRNASDLLWTGRFTIASSTGATVPAPNATQPDGQAIPWGTGALTDPSKAVPPPSYFPGGSPSTGSNSTASVPAAGSASPATSTPVVTPSTAPAATPQYAVPSGASTSSSSSGSSASPSEPARSGNDANGAHMLSAMSARSAQAGVVLAVVAGAFTFMV